MTPAFAIRFAMLLGVLLFGGVVMALRQSESAPEGSTEDFAALLTIGRVLWGLAIAGTAFLWFKARDASERTRTSWSIGAWALGEMVALLGGVVWMLTGSPAWYVPGLLFLVLTFMAFPGRPARS
jgi:hypothetical protein